MATPGVNFREAVESKVRFIGLIERKNPSLKRSLRIWTVAVTFFAQILFGLTLQVAVAPQASAACATEFPTVGWQAIRTTTGAELTDPKNDFTPYPSGGTADISSATGSPMDWFSSGDGCDFFVSIIQSIFHGDHKLRCDA